MLIFIILAVICGGCFLGGKYLTRGYGSGNEAFNFGCFISGLILIFALALMPLIRNEVKSDCVEYYQTAKSIEKARKTADAGETYAITQSVIKANNWLAKTKYWNKTIWNYYIPDMVEEFEMIK